MSRTTITSESSAEDLEADVQRELLRCPGCPQDVHTKPAEGIPAQALRACDQCDHVFFQDLDQPPRYDAA